jgi:3-oxo-5alpha-steroid 4-dehydrogenase
MRADMVVVGFGAAGASAALEAAADRRSVIIVERFTGGGATALSGGVVYAGGGTAQQRAAGVTDTAGAMLGYLRTEVGDAAPDETLREFCDGSVAMLAWLEGHGVPFEGSLCPDKTSYPSNRHYLYYSGSELSAGGQPAPRGHRAKGRGTSGRVLFARLAAAVRRSGVTVLTHTSATALLVEDGRVAGVECRALRGAPRVAHALLYRLSRKPLLYVPKLGRLALRPLLYTERRFSHPLTIRASHGVVLAAGGFGGDRAALRTHAPGSRGGLPLATAGEDGAGLSLGQAAGGAARFLDRVSIWRFLSPPAAFTGGIVVGPDGKRICDESRYGAAIGDAVRRSGGRAWLLVDAAIVARARRQLRGPALWFQRVQGWYLLATRVTAPTVAGVAGRAGVDPAGLTATVASYHAGPPDEFGKPAVTPLTTPPYSLIDCSIRPRLFYPAPVLTLGGLVTDTHARVLRADGTPVPGLYAAGRSAVGLCSHSYVSGLSLADCVFSGRRAGRLE